MSWNWFVRLLLIVLLAIYLLISRVMLRDRKKYHSVLEHGPLNVLFVVIYNALCYLAVGIRSDPAVIPEPRVLEYPIVANWYMILGQILVVAAAIFLAYTVTRRKAIGGQDTRGTLFTRGIYSFSRHPVYTGVVIISLGIAIIRTNVDGMLIFPLVFLANYIQAKLEEEFDVGVRFEEEYKDYRKRTHMFGPYWFWLMLLLILLVPFFLILVG
jgi:protein-S-isoprenylcysteine O-methyltransferase Ste14